MDKKDLIALWDVHTKEWREPEQITSQWQEALNFDKDLLRYTAKESFWEILAKLKITLLITREYEHLVMAISHDGSMPTISFQPMPHPSGLVVNHANSTVHIASTRNPNQLYEFEPVTNQLNRKDQKSIDIKQQPLIPARSHFYPGCMYFHDLALINNELYANAVAHNAIVKLHKNGGYERVWWPNCIEKLGPEGFALNYLQLNSIAPGHNLPSSFFSASTDKILQRRRPGQKSFSVDKRGVIYSGETREPCVTGLTRPHSARLHQKKLWIDNSGYGEFGHGENGNLNVVTKLPGWTRGLCFIENIAFVGTSRVIPKFSHYAPGLVADKSQCGIHAIDITNGRILGSLLWPYGNQLFAIDWISSQKTSGFPFQLRKQSTRKEKHLFYAFETQSIYNRSLHEPS